MKTCSDRFPVWVVLIAFILDTRSPGQVIPQSETESRLLDQKRPHNNLFRTVAQTTSVNLSGSWDSNLGSVSLSQSGNRLSGSLRFSNGTVATIVGTIQGITLSFRWNIPNSQVYGDGTLTANKDGSRLSGPYTDRSTGTRGQFVLTRRVARPSTPSDTSPRTFNPNTNRTNTTPASGTSFKLPTRAKLDRLASDDIRELLRDSVKQLEIQLDPWRSADGWKKHLNLEQLKIMTSGQKAGIPSSITRGELLKIAETFDAVSRETKYQKVAELTGFQSVRLILPIYAAEPTEIYRRQLTTSLGGFIGSLESSPRGDGWKTYLKTDKLTATLAIDTNALTIDDRILIKEQHDRFEAIRGNDKFRAIVKMPGFENSFHNIRDLVFYPSSFPAGASLFRAGGAQENNRDTRDIHLKTINERVTFGWDVSKVESASGITWQIGRLGFPFFDGGSQNDRQPVGLVLSGNDNGAKGSFTVDFGECAKQLPPPGHPFVVRAMPTTGTTIVGQPSNILYVYIGDSPKSNVDTSNIDSKQGVLSGDGPLTVSITLTYLSATKTNEDDDYSDDLISPAGQAAGDEPYMFLSGFHATNGMPEFWIVPQVPAVGGVQGNGSHHPVLTNVYKYRDVKPGEVIGFEVTIMESDHLDRVSTTGLIGEIGGLVSGIGTAIATENPLAAFEAYQAGKKSLQDLTKEIPALNDGDDFLGFREIKWDSYQLTGMRNAVRDMYEDAAKGKGEVLTKTGKMYPRPSLKPEHQKEFRWPETIRFNDNEVDYTLGYSIQFKNHQYRGPYRP